MKIKNKVIYKLFSVLSLFFIFWIIETTLLTPRIGVLFSLYRAEHSSSAIILINIFCLLIALIIVALIKRKKVENDLSNKQAGLFLLFELIIYSLLLVLLIKIVGFSNPVDDTRITLNFLRQIEEGKQFGYDYMYSNPQNLMLMFFFMGIRMIFGNNFFFIIAAFIILHCCTILFTFHSLKNLKLSNKLSLLVVQVLLFALQITLHVPVAYTDVLSLFFISISIFFFTKFIMIRNSSTNSAGVKKINIYLLLTCFFSSLGYLSKGTVLIIIIALSVYLFFSEKKMRRCLFVLPFLILIVINMGWNTFVQHEQIFPDDNYGQPNTHYIMMGLSNTPIPENISPQQKSGWLVGTYNSDDQAYSWDLFLKQKLPKSDIQKKQLKIASQRWKKLSFGEKIEVLNNKVSVTWSSGDLKSSFEWKLGVDKEKNRLNIFTNKFSGLVLYCWMMVMQYIIYLGIAFSTIKFFNKKNPVIFFCNIFITGYFCFLLIWEASPRYAMGIFIPAILMIGLFLNKDKNDVETEVPSLKK